MSMDSANIPSNQQSSNDELYDQAAKRPFNTDGGEDEASVTDDGNESNLNDDQKPFHATWQADGPQKDRGLSSQRMRIRPHMQIQTVRKKHESWLKLGEISRPTTALTDTTAYV
jgi:hypothetical protein